MEYYFSVPSCSMGECALTTYIHLTGSSSEENPTSARNSWKYLTLQFVVSLTFFKVENMSSFQTWKSDT